LPENTRAELRRHLARLRVVREQVHAIEQERLRKLAAAPAADKGSHAMVRLIARVLGVGVETADMLVNEIFSRHWRDRRAVARYAGLTGSPDDSGSRRREPSRTWITLISMFCSRWVAKLWRKRMHGHRFADPGHVGSGMAGAVELARRHRLHRVAPWKQPTLRSRRPPPGAQQFEQMWRQHHVAVFAAFTLLDANDHALAVDADLQRHHLGDARSRAVSHAQRCFVLESRRGLEEACPFLWTQHHWQLARFKDECSPLDEIGPPEWFGRQQTDWPE